MFSSYQIQPMPPVGGRYAAATYSVQAPPLHPWIAPAPTDSLPGLLGQMSRDLTRTGLNPAIVAAQLPAVASLLTQALADTAWPNGQRVSIGFSAFLRVPSSGGKSLGLKLLRDPIARAVRAWSRENAQKNIDPAFFVEDATREAAIQHLIAWKSVALITDEAGQCKQLIKEAAPTLAKLNDGDDLHHARVKDGRVALTGHRFCILLTEQPGIDGAGNQLLAGTNAGVGLVNRMFVAEALATQMGAALHGVAFSNEVRTAYEARVETLIGRSIAHVIAEAERPLLRLSREAAAFLIASGDEMRNRFRGHPRELALSAYVARHAERMLRLAGVVQVFEFGTEGEIELHVMQAADAVGRWSVEQFARMTDVPPKPSQAEKDVQQLAEALRQMAVSGRIFAFWLADARRYAMNIGLTRARFDRALAELGGRGLVFVAAQEKRDVLYVQQALLSMTLPV